MDKEYFLPHPAKKTMPSYKTAVHCCVVMFRPRSLAVLIPPVQTSIVFTFNAGLLQHQPRPKTGTPWLRSGQPLHRPRVLVVRSSPGQLLVGSRYQTGRSMACCRRQEEARDGFSLRIPSQRPLVSGTSTQRCSLPIPKVLSMTAITVIAMLVSPTSRHLLRHGDVALSVSDNSQFSKHYSTFRSLFDT